MYRASNLQTKESKEFDFEDDETLQAAREAAVDLCIEWKNSSTRKRDYSGIRLELLVRVVEKNYDIESMTILTGRRMHTPEILEALWYEARVLKDWGLEFEKILMTLSPEKRGYIVQYKFSSLYYFTS